MCHILLNCWDMKPSLPRRSSCFVFIGFEFQLILARTLSLFLFPLHKWMRVIQSLTNIQKHTHQTPSVQRHLFQMFYPLFSQQQNEKWNNNLIMHCQPEKKKCFNITSWKPFVTHGFSVKWNCQVDWNGLAVWRWKTNTTHWMAAIM